jgi:uncharacterized RDD family membrane protein YckC
VPVVKCPKCLYLGFETGDRCRNCGYDFSLLALADPVSELPLSLDPQDVQTRAAETRRVATPSRETPFSETPAGTLPEGTLPEGTLPAESHAATAFGGDLLLQPDRVAGATPSDLPLHVTVDPAAPAFDLPWTSPAGDTTPAPAPAAPRAPSASPVRKLRTAAAPARDHTPEGLPLFAPDANPSDPPILRMAASAPRAPVAVRRSAEASRFQAALSARTRPPVANDEPASAPFGPRRLDVPPQAVHQPRARGFARPLTASTAGARGCAAALDLAILAAIDLAVLYFTLRMAQLPLDQWRQLPAWPLSVFIALLAFGYYASLTAFGGQTIGKMAAGIKVVADDELSMSPARACQRTLVAAASVATLGAAYAPALVGVGGRALHDRVAHTRVVAVASA